MNSTLYPRKASRFSMSGPRKPMTTATGAKWAPGVSSLRPDPQTPCPPTVPSFSVDDRGLIGVIAAIVGGLLASSLLVGGILYANDYELRATVKDTDCDPAGSQIKVQTKLFNIDHTVKDVPYDEC